MKNNPFLMAGSIAVIAVSLNFGLHGQNDDPFVKDVAAAKPKPGAAGPAAKPARWQMLRESMGCLVEYIEVDHLEAVRLLRIHGSKLDSTPLRNELEELISANRARLMESVYIPSPSGQRVKRESILEKIYPTEYDPPEIPQYMMLRTKDGKVTGAIPNDLVSGLKTAANPTAFDTRNVGATVELDPVLAADGEEISISVAPEMVEFKGWRFFLDRDSPHTESRDIRMPKFSTMKTSSQIVMRNGQYALLGCHTPSENKGKRVLVLIKVDVLK